MGKISYVQRNTRADIAWICCELQRYGTNYTEAQIDALTHLIKYLKGTKDMAITFRTGFDHQVKLVIAVDAGYGTSLINRASHEGLMASTWVVALPRVKTSEGHRDIFDEVRVLVCDRGCQVQQMADEPHSWF